MSGIATQFVLLDLVRSRLESSGNPLPTQIADVLKTEPIYAYLGAIGPDLMDCMPNDLTPGALGGASAYLTFWRTVFSIASGSPATPGLVPTLEKLTGYLDKLDKIAADEDLDALKQMQGSGEINDVNAAMNDLKTIVESLPSLIVPLITSISVGQKPVVNVALNDPVPPPIAWSCRDFLHWKKPGSFVRALYEQGKSLGDKRFLAYAYGYAIAYTAKVCGSPFLDSIVGGPYRTQWWRYRWINMANDAWCHGFYRLPSRPAFSGDIPNPGYEQWPNLCNANLQQNIELPGIDPKQLLKLVAEGGKLPDILPIEFSQFWFAAFKDAYGDPPSGSRFSEASMNGAYLLTWLVLWFQTSGKVLGCNPAPPMAPPDDDCGDAPPWVDLSTSAAGSGGTPNLPPEPQVESDPDVGEIVCGVILAILGLGILFTGNLAVGGGALAGAVALIIGGATDINWGKLRCLLHWYRIYLYNGLKALHQASVLTGITHPHTSELAIDETTLKLLGFDFTFDSGKRIVKSRLQENFPASIWVGAAPSWTQNPTGIEPPLTFAYYRVAYPDWWIDNAAANPLSNGQVRIGGDWPMKTAVGSKLPAEFGNAVENAVDVLMHLDTELPDWNLDGDRGLAYLTWEFDGNYTHPVNIKQES